MWIRIFLSIFFVLLAYILFLLLYINKSKSKKEKVKEDSLTENKTSKAVKTVVIKAVKNKPADLAIITNRYIFDENSNNNSEDKKEDSIGQQIPELQIEVTINDESLISELESNETLNDIERMADLLKKMSSNEIKIDSEKSQVVKSEDYSDYKDFDDALISEYLNTNFLKNSEDNN